MLARLLGAISVVNCPVSEAFHGVDDNGLYPVESFCAFKVACGESLTILVFSVTADFQLYNWVDSVTELFEAAPLRSDVVKIVVCYLLLKLQTPKFFCN